MKVCSIFYIVGFLFLLSCNAPKKIVRSIPQDEPVLKLLDVYDIPFGFEFQNTKVGGLSGIDYNRQENVYYLVSDDRSERFPARFYTAAIDLANDRIDSVRFLETTLLKGKDGSLYSSAKEDPLRAPDPESIRFNKSTGDWVWTSEGERITNGLRSVLQNPSINVCGKDGILIDTFSLPEHFRMSTENTGPRRNSVFEGATFSEDFRELYVSTEEPLYNDGPRAGLYDSTGIIRITKYDVATRAAIAEYAYQLDPVQTAPNPPGAFEINGVSEILWYGKNKLLVLERSFSSGNLGCHIRLYLADLSRADDVLNLPRVQNNDSTKMASKKLLLNFNSLGRFVDNLEGMTFGPQLQNGHQTLLLVADDNFLPLEKSQLFLFEIH